VGRRKLVASWWTKLVVMFKGKEVAILGPRSSGKTTLYHLLAHGQPPSKSEATVTAEKTDVFRNRELGLNIRRGVDLPGADRAYPQWRSQFSKSDIVLYLFDSQLLRTDPEYGRRVRQDGKEMERWGCSGKRIFLIGTHADLDPRCTELGADKYAVEILDEDVLFSLSHRVKASGSVVGSLTSSRSAVALLRPVLGG